MLPLSSREIANSVSALTRQQMDDQDKVSINEASRTKSGRLTVLAV
jgi:outer membrane receptor for ferric coprogen and ferric-rhodotorulic acid